MPNALSVLAGQGEASPRRSIVQVLAGAGLGVLALGRGEQDARARRKKKPCKGCPKSCRLVFSQAGGGTICGITNTAPDPCVPCTSSNQCAAADETFPHCVTHARLASGGAKEALACPGSPPGICSAVAACVI